MCYYTPNSALYEAAAKPGSGNRPVPWNQQAMLNNGFQRLAECHTLLGDAPERVKHYDAIVKASVDWFFGSVERVTVNDHVCYKWAYVFEDPPRHTEDLGHGGEDVAGLYRAYLSGRYGITAAMMEPFANTVLYVMRTPEGKFIPRVDGVLKPHGHGPGGLGGKWLGLAEFVPELFPIFCNVNRGRIKSSPEITADILWQRQPRAPPPKSPPPQGNKSSRLR